MSEDIIRRIRELEKRIKEQKEKIAYVETILRVIEEEHPRLTREELMLLPEYRHSYYGRLGLIRWLRTYEKELEELKKMIPPYTHKRIRLTFSIETGMGHEPFLAEITCDTVIPKDADEDEVIRRVVHATIKYFWILFDVRKDITKDMEMFWGSETYSQMVRRAIFFQKHAKEVYEEAMDEFLMKLLDLGGLTKTPDKYVTTEAILNIGVETPIPATEKSEPKYPRVHVFIDKKEKYEFTKDIHIRIAPESKFNLLRILGIKLEMGGE